MKLEEIKKNNLLVINVDNLFKKASKLAKNKGVQCKDCLYYRNNNLDIYFGSKVDENFLQIHFKRNDNLELVLYFTENKSKIDMYYLGKYDCDFDINNEKVREEFKNSQLSLYKLL